jgi:hypothetical protein
METFIAPAARTIDAIHLATGKYILLHGCAVDDDQLGLKPFFFHILSDFIIV